MRVPRSPATRAGKLESGVRLSKIRGIDCYLLAIPLGKRCTGFLMSFWLLPTSAVTRSSNSESRMRRSRALLCSGKSFESIQRYMESFPLLRWAPTSVDINLTFIRSHVQELLTKKSNRLYRKHRIANHL